MSPHSSGDRAIYGRLNMQSIDLTWQSNPRRTRRRFLRDTAPLTAAGSLAALPLCAAAEPPVAEAVEQAHAEIWRRFIDRHHVMLDFTMLDGSVSLPTPEELFEQIKKNYRAAA